MKNIPLKLSMAIASAAFASSVVQAEGLQLSDKLSVTGFIDMSATYTEVDAGGTTSSSAAGLDQFEMDFMYDFGDGLTAQADLQYTNPGIDVDVTDPANPVATPTGGTVIEQGFFNYAFSDELSVKAGRFLAYSGWEAAEPTGLYQYSATPLAGEFYGGYQQGASVLYSNGTYDVALSAVNDLYNGTETDSSQLGLEAMLAFYPSEQLTIKGFYLTEAADSTIDIWGSYTMDALTFALEYAMKDYDSDAESTGILAMVNYASGDMGVTFRYHMMEMENPAGATTVDTSGITISPSYAVTENLLVLAEYRMDTEDTTDVDTNTFAVEALISY